MIQKIGASPKGGESPGTRGGAKGPVRLTEELVANLPIDGHDRIVFDTLQPGFGVRVTPAGTKLFVVQARVGGRPRRVSVGVFGDKKVSTARSDAIGALADLRAGRDPKVEKATRSKEIERGQTTVSDFADRWYRDYVEPMLKPRTASDYARILKTRIKPTFGHLIVGRVMKEDVLAWHSAMRKIPRRANYCLAVFRSLMSYAEQIGLRPEGSNPCKGLRLYREGARERFLSEAEFREAATAIAATEKAGKIGPHAAGGLRLALFTGARQGELLSAKWSHIDWERRIIRLPDSKTNEPRTIHLSEAALEVLKGLPRVGPYVVAGALENEAYRSLSRAWAECRDAAGLSDVRLHDLRHSYASLAAAQGVSLQMIGKLLGHKVPATTARYAHLARDAAADVNDQLGAAMTAAIEKGSQPRADIVKLKLPRRRARGR